MTARRMDRTRCGMTTQSLRACGRLANRYYVNASDDVVGALCAQHSDGYGAARILRPLPWSYVRIVDRSGRTLYRRPV